MSVVVIDDATREKLLGPGDDLVLRDSAGKVVGLFIRQQPPPEDFEMVGTPFTEEEIARHMKESKRIPAAEVEEHLRRLTKCE